MNEVVKITLQLAVIAGAIAAMGLISETVLRFQAWWDRSLTPRIRARIAEYRAKQDPTREDVWLTILRRRAIDRLLAMPLREEYGLMFYNCPFCDRGWAFAPFRRLGNEATIVEHLVHHHPDRLRGLDRNGPTLAVKT